MTQEQRSAIEEAPGFSCWSPYFETNVMFTGDPMSFENDMAFIMGPDWEDTYTIIVNDMGEGWDDDAWKQLGFTPIFADPGTDDYE